jgi:hypothetical protein
MKRRSGGQELGAFVSNARGGDLRDNPPQARLARPWPAHAAPRSSPLFAQHPRSTCVSLRTARQVVKPNVEELRARPAVVKPNVEELRARHKDHRSGAGARDAVRPDPQLWLARAHTQAPAHRDACGRLTRNLRRCPTLRPPPAPSSLTTQFQTVENCQPSNPTNFGLVFRSPRILRVFGDLMSNISATRGSPDMRFCVCGSTHKVKIFHT